MSGFHLAGVVPGLFFFFNSYCFVHLTDAVVCTALHVI